MQIGVQHILDHSVITDLFINISGNGIIYRHSVDDNNNMINSLQKLEHTQNKGPSL